MIEQEPKAIQEYNCQLRTGVDALIDDGFIIKSGGEIGRARNGHMELTGEDGNIYQIADNGMVIRYSEGGKKGRTPHGTAIGVGGLLQLNAHGRLPCFAVLFFPEALKPRAVAP